MKDARFILLLIVLGVCLWANSLNNSFIWDDGSLIAGNHLIKNWHQFKTIFLTSYARQGVYYRPLAIFSHLLEYPFYGLDPFGYHLTNLILHIINAILVYFILKLTFTKALIAPLSSLLFLIHPLQTEEVTYISGRCGLLSALFILLSLLLYILYTRGKKRVAGQKKGSRAKIGTATFFRRKMVAVLFLRGPGCGFYPAAWFCFILALLAKETALILPLLLVFYDFYAGGVAQVKAGRRGYLLFFLTIAGYVWGRNMLAINFINFSSVLVNLHLRVLAVAKIFITYLGLLFLPLDLHYERLQPLLPLDTAGLWALAASLLVIAGLIKLSRRRPPVLFGAAWFFITILPTAHIVPLSVAGYLLAYEHFLYLPSLGFFIIVSCAIAGLAQSKAISRSTVFAVFAAFLVFYSLLTIRRNLDWKDPLRFYQLTAKRVPHSLRIHALLGNAYNSRAAFPQAIAEFKKAIELKPDYALAHNNLGIAYVKTGQPRLARQQFNRAREITPSNPDAYNNIAFLDSQQGDLSTAIDNYKKALELNPHYAQAYNNLGVAYFKTGLLTEAQAAWQEALNIDPDCQPARENLRRFSEQRQAAGAEK